MMLITMKMMINIIMMITVTVDGGGSGTMGSESLPQSHARRGPCVAPKRLEIGPPKETSTNPDPNLLPL